MNEHGIAVSKPLGFNNTYVMGVRPETAKRYGIRTLSEMMGVADKLRLGCTVGFVQRGDCLPLMKNALKRTLSPLRDCRRVSATAGSRRKRWT